MQQLCSKLEVSCMATINSVRVVKTKYGTYSIQFTNPDGRRRRLSIGTNHMYAQRIAMKFSDWLLEGKDPEYELDFAEKKEQIKSVSLREFFFQFMERHGSHQRDNTQNIYYYRFNQLCRCPSIVDIPIRNISKRLILDYMNLRMKQDGASPATVNREAALVKNILFRAIEWDVLDSNPLQGLKLLSEANKRLVMLSPGQAANLIDELQEPIASIVELAIYTGFRKNSILTLRIESIRFHDITPTGEVELIVKGGQTEKFPLCTPAVEVLKRVIGERKKGYVFINPKTGDRFYWIHKSFNRAVRNLGLTVNNTKLRFHDLRHVFATWLHEAGVGVDIISPLLGHHNRETTNRYVTFNRLSYSSALNTIPKIKRTSNKETSNNRKIKSLSRKNGKNWQGEDRSHMLFLPPTAVSS